MTGDEARQEPAQEYFSINFDDAPIALKRQFLERVFSLQVFQPEVRGVAHFGADDDLMTSENDAGEVSFEPTESSIRKSYDLLEALWEHTRVVQPRVPMTINEKNDQYTKIRKIVLAQGGGDLEEVQNFRLCNHILEQMDRKGFRLGDEIVNPKAERSVKDPGFRDMFNYLARVDSDPYFLEQRARQIPQLINHELDSIASGLRRHSRQEPYSLPVEVLEFIQHVGRYMGKLSQSTPMSSPDASSLHNETSQREQLRQVIRTYFDEPENRLPAPFQDWQALENWLISAMKEQDLRITDQPMGGGRIQVLPTDRQPYEPYIM